MDNLHQQMLNAALQNDLNTVEKLVSQGADINYNDKWGNCAIFPAACNGDINTLDMFYSLGAIIDLGDKNLRIFYFLSTARQTTYYHLLGNLIVHSKH